MYLSGVSKEKEVAYSSRFKEKMVAKALSPGNSIRETAKLAGIPKSTLFEWVAWAKVGSMTNGNKKKRGRPRKSTTLSPEKKLQILVESAGLSDEELGAYMRREGLHEVDLKEIREAALLGLRPVTRTVGPTREEKRIKKLQRELTRKDKALAEAAALLVFQKKFHALLEEEGDDTDETNEDD